MCYHCLPLSPLPLVQVKQLWADNPEIATHTIHHYQMRPSLAAKVNFTRG